MLNLRNSTIPKMTFSLVLALLLILLSCSAYAADTQAVYVRSAPLETKTNAKNGMVRVYLASLGNPSTLDLTINGSYSLSINGERLASGSSVRVQFSPSSGKLTVTSNNRTLDAGNGFSLKRYSAAGTNGILIAQAKESRNPYPGDLSFEVAASGGSYVLYPIAHVYLEEYLYGVVPYEMGNSSGLEALKAQAVAARTYIVRMMERRATSRYDVKDTTSDQVYRGTPSGNANCKAAVDATKGIVLMYGSEYITTYYGASNGGQTEIARDGSAAAYMTVKDDPFDYQNTSSVVKKTTVYADLQNSGNPSGLISLLKSKAASSLQRMGYPANEGNISLVTLTAVTPHTPKYASPSRLYTLMDFTFTVSAPNAAGVVSTVSLTETCSVFGELESMLGMSIQSLENELWTVQKQSGSFVLQARRYGHGMGMSQRGAMQMARQGYTYDQILGFYYEGCSRVQHSFTHTILNSSTGNQDVTVEPPADLENDSISSCQGKVILSDVGGKLAIRAQQSSTAKIIGAASNGDLLEVLVINGQWAMVRYGEIVGYVPVSALSISGQPSGQTQNMTDILGFATVTANDYVNLRASAGMSAKIVGTAPYGAVLTVFSKSGDWARAQYGPVAAYVSTRYISSVVSEYPSSQDVSGSRSAVVTTRSGTGTVNLRQSASTNARIVDRLAAGTQVTVLSDDGSWCMISYASGKGYMLKEYLKYVNETENGGADSEEENENTQESLYAVVTTPSGSLNLRESAAGTSRILTTIPRSTRVYVLKKGAEWSQVRYGGYDGYVMSSFLTFESSEEPDDDAATVPPETAPALQAVVTTPGGSLNLRSQASGNSQILDRIPANTVVNVLERGNDWCRVEYGKTIGYVMSSFLCFDDEQEAPPPENSGETKPSDVISAYVNTQSGSLNMRSKPSLRAGIVTTIPRGAAVSVLEKADEWCAVRYQDFQGYVMTQYLAFETSSENQTPEEPQAPEENDDSVQTPSEPVYAWVNTASGSLNMRSAADGNAVVLTTIPRLARVTVLDPGSEWIRIRYQSLTGYVMSRFLTGSDPALTETESAAQSDEPAMDATLKTPDEVLYGYVFDDTALYPACEESEALITVPAAARVDVVMTGETWCCVRYENVTGYCLTRKMVLTNE